MVMNIQNIKAIDSPAENIGCWILHLISTISQLGSWFFLTIVGLNQNNKQNILNKSCMMLVLKEKSLIII